MTYVSDRSVGCRAHQIAIIFLTGLQLSAPAFAQSHEDVMKQAADYHALVAAENSTSAVCRAYVGKTVIPATFDALATNTGTSGPKGEFETTAQYRERLAITSAAVREPSVLALPTDSDYIRYDADAGSFNVLAGAFPIGDNNSEAQAQVAIMLSLPEPMNFYKHTRIYYSEKERVVSTSTARSALGLPVRVSEVERRTRAIFVPAPHLFSFAIGSDSTVMRVGAAPAIAKRLKPSLKVALVGEPVAPFVVSGKMSGSAATARNPIHYTERTSVLVMRARCGLVLNAQNRVLASADAGDTSQQSTAGLK